MKKNRRPTSGTGTDEEDALGYGQARTRSFRFWQSLFSKQVQQTAGEHISFLGGTSKFHCNRLCQEKARGYDSTPCMKTYLSASLIEMLIFTFLLALGRIQMF